MSKSLEDILNGTTEDETVTTSLNEDKTVSDLDEGTTVVTNDETAAAPDETDNTTVVDTPDSELDDNTGDADPQAEEEETTEATVDTTFVPKVVHLTKTATLYGNRDATKVIGAFKGTIRQVDVAINGVAPIEYTVISAGNKIVKRAFIHI